MKPDFVAHTPSSKDPNRWHDLKDHLIDVAKGTAEFAHKLGAGQLGYYAGLWHDLGKYNPKFQAYLQKCHTAKLADQKPPREKVPHAIHGAFLAKELGCQPLGFLIAGHHAGLSNLKGENSLDQKLKNTEQLLVYQALLPVALKEMPSVKTSEDLRSYFKTFGQDRIAVDLFLRLIFSCLIDADRLDTEKFANSEQFKLRKERANVVPVDQIWEVFERKQAEFVSRSTPSNPQVGRVRADVYQHCLEAAEWKPGIFRLCVPTGGGKTRSGLAFALKHANQYKKDRVIFAVPHTSIIEQTVKVYREEIFAEVGDVAVLEHHSATQGEQKLSDEKLEQLEVDEKNELIHRRVVIFDPAEGGQPKSVEYSIAIQKTKELLQLPDFREAQLHEPDIFQAYFQDLYALISNTEGRLDKKGSQCQAKFVLSAGWANADATVGCGNRFVEWWHGEAGTLPKARNP